MHVIYIYIHMYICMYRDIYILTFKPMLCFIEILGPLEIDVSSLCCWLLAGLLGAGMKPHIPVLCQSFVPQLLRVTIGRRP